MVEIAKMRTIKKTPATLKAEDEGTCVTENFIAIMEIRKEKKRE